MLVFTCVRVVYLCVLVSFLSILFFFSSRRRHTRCALVTGFRRVLFRSQGLRSADAQSTGTPMPTKPNLPRWVRLWQLRAQRRTRSEVVDIWRRAAMVGDRKSVV